MGGPEYKDPLIISKYYFQPFVYFWFLIFDHFPPSMVFKSSAPSGWNEGGVGWEVIGPEVCPDDPCLEKSLGDMINDYYYYLYSFAFWLAVTFFGSLWLSLALFGSLWLYLALFGSIWLYFALFGSLALYGPFWFSLCISGSLWLSLASSYSLYGSHQLTRFLLGL